MNRPEDTGFNELEERRQQLGWSIKQVAEAYADRLGEPRKLHYLSTIQRIFERPNDVTAWRKELVIEIMGGSSSIGWTPLHNMPSEPQKKK